MKIGDCFLMDHNLVGVFRITKVFDTYCRATDIIFGDLDDGVGYTYTDEEMEEDYPNDLMESRIPVPEELYFQLKESVDELRSSLQTLIDNGILEDVFEPQAQRSYFSGSAIYTLLEQKSGNEWKMRCFQIDDVDIIPSSWVDTIDITIIMNGAKSVGAETLEKAYDLYREWYQKALQMVAPYRK